MVTELRRDKDKERKDRTKASLLDAAERVFSARGFHKTLISQIVSEAGVGQGTFYRYFKTKREIFQTLFERFVDRLFAQFKPMTADLPADVDQYRAASVAALRRMMAIIEVERESTLIFLREGPSIDREFETLVADVYDRFAQLAQFYLEHAQRQGFARQCNAKLVAQALIGVGLRLLHSWLGDRLSGESVDAMIEEIVEFAFLGFGNSGPQPT